MRHRLLHDIGIVSLIIAVSFGAIVVIKQSNPIATNQHIIDSFTFISSPLTMSAALIGTLRDSLFPGIENIYLENVPTEIRAIYIRPSIIVRPGKIEEIIKLTRETSINAIVIDIKDVSGRVAYSTDNPALGPHQSGRGTIDNIETILRTLHAEGIYVIGRLVVFRDPLLARTRPDLAIQTPDGKLWSDAEGAHWLDPSAREAWRYIAAIAKDADSRGFDEINLDYIRFPSDGWLAGMRFPHWNGASKEIAVTSFLAYLRTELPETVLSADIFGLATTHEHDLGIGQVIEHMAEYVDFIAPMIYPDQYPSGHLGYSNPATQPYEVVRNALEDARRRMPSNATTATGIARLRPWLQAFSINTHYTPKRIRAQINAVTDARRDGVFDGSSNLYNGFMLWNSVANYNKEALIAPTSGELQ